MKIDHIGYAVKRIKKSIEEFEKLGYHFENIITDEKRNVYICFGNLDGYRIELVSPIKNDKVSPVDSYISEYVNIPYHICYESSELEKDIADLCLKGFKVIISPEEACAFQNRRVAFLINLGVGIIELVENV